jgi:hypothetical protein
MMLVNSKVDEAPRGGRQERCGAKNKTPVKVHVRIRHPDAYVENNFLIHSA